MQLNFVKAYECSVLSIKIILYILIIICNLLFTKITIILQFYTILDIY